MQNLLESSFGLVIIGIWVAAAFGWVANLVKLVFSVIESDPVNALFIGRCVGAFVAPLGAVLGYF